MQSQKENTVVLYFPLWMDIIVIYLWYSLKNKAHCKGVNISIGCLWRGIITPFARRLGIFRVWRVTEAHAEME
jgi:hypothetical protein